MASHSNSNSNPDNPSPRTKAGKRKKFAKVIREFKAGKLNIGGSKTKVSSRKQAVAIALSETGQSRAQMRAKKKRRRAVRRT